MGYFLNKRIDVSQRLGESDEWMLDDVLSFVSERHQVLVTAPQGFLTDFASVPWLFRRLIAKSGKHNGAAVIHDYLYRCSDDAGLLREVCDDIFDEALEALGVSAILAKPMWAAVRVGGSAAYNKNSPGSCCEGGYVVPVDPHSPTLGV